MDHTLLTSEKNISVLVSAFVLRITLRSRGKNLYAISTARGAGIFPAFFLIFSARCVCLAWHLLRVWGRV